MKPTESLTHSLTPFLTLYEIQWNCVAPWVATRISQQHTALHLHDKTMETSPTAHGVITMKITILFHNCNLTTQYSDFQIPRNGFH